MARKVALRETFYRAGSELTLSIDIPFLERLPSPTVVWRCAYFVSRDGVSSRGEASGESSFEVLSLATQAVRMQIPESEEAEWKTADGVASWVVLPRAIKIGLGYKTYRAICEAEDRIIQGVLAKLPDDDGQA